MYAKTSDMTSARKVFDDMPLKSLASWTSMAIGYARGGEAGAAMELFQLMPEKDTAAFNAMIDVFVKKGHMASARRLFDEMSDRNVVSWTSLISGYCKVGDMEAASVLFDAMPEKNLYSWNVMIGGHCQNRQPHQALELFRELQSTCCLPQPDNVTLVSVLPAVADLGAIDLGRWIHSYARRKGLDQVITVSIGLVDMYAKCGDVCEARRVFDSMPIRDTAAWNAMINGLAVNGRAKAALAVFTEMRRAGVCPNEVTMIGVLSACSHGGLVEEGRRWFNEMEALHVERRVEHYGCMVDLLGRSGRLGEAETLLEEIPCGPNGIVLSSLLFACGRHGDMERAERAMRRASAVEPGNWRNYVVMRNLYARKKKWRDVERMQEAVRDHGGKREAGCSVVEVGHRAWEFVSGDRVHPQSQSIYELLDELLQQIKGQGEEEEDRLILASEVQSTSSVNNGGKDGSGRTHLYLNVYDLTPVNKYLYWFGLGVFHSGIEVHGMEYGFGAHEYPTSGVFEVEPKSCPGFIFRRSVWLGTTDMSRSEFRLFIEDLAGKYHGDTYHLIIKNCNHFTDEVCMRLTGKPIPGWVNRLARLGHQQFLYFFKVWILSYYLAYSMRIFFFLLPSLSVRVSPTHSIRSKITPPTISCSLAIAVMDEGSKSTASFPKVASGSRSSLGTPAFSGGHSASTSGSAGSPSSRSDPAARTPASENTLVRLNHLDIQGEDEGTPEGAVSGKKKKRGVRAVGGDKSGRGLRQFSMKVCEKVESKGRTTYNEVADELVTEFTDPNNNPGSQDQQQYDEKNIRRRVYDALNVLMAMDIISKDKKEIQWKGLPRTSLNDIEELKAERTGLKNRIEKKTAYLQELQDQFIGLQNLVQRNEQLYGSGHIPSGGVALPFILVQTRPHATVEVEISEDMQLVHFDFNSTPFELHDDSYVLKAMGLCERGQHDGAPEPSSNGGDCSSMSGMYQHETSQGSRSSSMGKMITSPPKPGILKARVKNEH
ncbi:unnamed protein product [Musa hybrid cultivar]